MLIQVINKEELKKLHDKDFVIWVEENLKLLRDKQFDLVDWERLLEEIEDMGNRHWTAKLALWLLSWSIFTNWKILEKMKKWV